MATVNNGEFTINGEGAPFTINGEGAGQHALWFSNFFFSTKTLIFTQNWLFLVNFLMFFSSLVFFRVHTIRLMRLPKVFSKVFIKTSNKRISSHSSTNTILTKN